VKGGKEIKFRIALENFKARRSGEKDFKLQVVMSATYNDLVPPSTNKLLNFSVKQLTAGSLEKGTLGKVFQYKADISYLDSQKGAGMTVAIIRVPSCLKINFELLEKMRDNADFDMYEVRNNNSEIVLYWRQAVPNFKKSLTFSMI